MSKHVVATVSEIPPGQRKLVTVRGRSIAVFNLDEYSRPGEILRCPWHGWEFDVKTGQSFCDPSKISVRSYPMEVAPGQTVVQGPYVAETLPVTVEEQYVIVEMA